MSTYEQLDEWRQNVLGEFVDNRIVDAAWLDCWVWFWLHLYADLANYDSVFRGAVFRQDDDYCLLVLKVSAEDIPQVVFVSGSSPTSCVRKLRNKLRDGSIIFSRDKFA
jgi:hypothetical protein